MRRLLALFGLAVLLAACGTTPAPVEEIRPPATRATSVPLPPGYYRVKRGDTLYAIAFLYGCSYQQLAQWNGIAPPYTIYVGQRLRVMAPSVPPPSSQVRILTAELPPSATRADKGVGAPPTTVQPAPEPLPAGPLRWTWPAQGALLHRFDPDGAGRKGIDIRGRRGQTVSAAAPGWVVYSGSGLIGYGQLVIIKHDKSLLSAYAYNDRLLVKEGEFVRAGQRIADMGVSGSEGSMLHFEIRRDGQPVNPLTYLPHR